MLNQYIKLHDFYFLLWYYLSWEIISTTNYWFPFTILFLFYWFNIMLNFFNYSDKIFQFDTLLKVLVDVDNYLREGDWLVDMWFIMLYMSIPFRISFWVNDYKQFIDCSHYWRLFCFVLAVMMEWLRMEEEIERKCANIKDW